MGNKIIERAGYAINLNSISHVGPVDSFNVIAKGYSIYVNGMLAVRVEFDKYKDLVGETYANMPDDAKMAACEALATASRATLIEAMSCADA